MVKSGLIAFACSISLCAYAFAETPQRIDVPAGDLGAALEIIAKQAGVELVFRPDQVKGLRTEGVSGALSAEDAIRRLLEGTPLKLRTDSATGAMMIGTTEPTARSNANDTADRQTASRSKGRWMRLRLAQTDTAVSQRANVPEEHTSAAPEPTSQKPSAQLEEVLVTGTHIRGVDNPTAPLIVMDRAFIESTGLTTTVQLIESLPQNFALVNQSVAGGSISGNSFATIQGATINLRGMGEGTTLTLVNGRRMPLGYDGSAVNIAALPLAAIERVEVLTDGASALYGSDAVGGVVNFVFRRDFEGAETRALYGHADSVDESRISQLYGRSWQSGNFVVSGDYYSRDMLLASDRKLGIGNTTLVPSLLPEEENYAFSLFGRQTLNERFDVFLDAIYTSRDSFNRSFQATSSSNANLYIDNAQLSAAAGLGWNLARSWRAELSAGYGKDDLDVHIIDSLAIATDGRTPIISEITGVDLKADGPVLELPAGTVRVAVGAHWREEQHDYALVSRNAAGAIVNNFSFEDARNVGSLFTEASIPIVGTANARPFLKRLDLSLAARYDDYSDFGSSIDPRIGLAWTPVDGLRVRGSWGTSYLAPKMKDYEVALNTAIAVDSYPLANGLDIIVLGGTDPSALKPQEATNYTLGLDWAPAFLPGATLALNYYDIDYRDKIESLNLTPQTILANPAEYGPLVILDPTVAQVNEYIIAGSLGRPFTAFNPDFTRNPNFNPAAVDAIFDLRRRNIGAVSTKGVDVSGAYDFAAAGGNVHLGLDVVYIFDLLTQITSTSTPFDEVDTFANPTHLRLRAGVGYRRGAWSFNSFVHRKNAYTDNRFTPYEEIEPYTTVDVNGAWRFGESAGVLSNVSIRLGASNLFDRQPPNLRVRGQGSYDLGFDAANASPLGRLLTVDLAKRW